jgi:hypothetical protein
MSESNSRRVVEAVYRATGRAEWEWPESARERLSLYCAAGRFTDKDQEACVRNIVHAVEAHVAP